MSRVWGGGVFPNHSVFLGFLLNLRQQVGRVLRVDFPSPERQAFCSYLGFPSHTGHLGESVQPLSFRTPGEVVWG